MIFVSGIGSAQTESEEKVILVSENEKKSIFSKTPNLPILSFWILNLHIIICQFQKKSIVIHFFVSLHVPATSECKKAELLRLQINN